MSEYVNYIGATLSMQVNNEIEAFAVRSVKACAPLDQDITINAKKIYEAIKNAEIYKWHDLRKDPEDLPRMVTDEDSETVIVVDSLGEYHSAYWWNYANGWMSVDGGLVDDVVAWRYIEPFEEDNE